MKYEIHISPDGEEKVIIYARENSPLVESIKSLLEKSDSTLMGYRDKEVFPLDPASVYCITVVQNKVYAICEKERYLLKERLYSLEERLPCFFVKINQSSIANFNKIERFDTSISGTLKLVFKNGHVEYVSRRQLKLIKERLGV